MLRPPRLFKSPLNQNLELSRGARFMDNKIINAMLNTVGLQVYLDIQQKCDTLSTTNYYQIFKLIKDSVEAS